MTHLYSKPEPLGIMLYMDFQQSFNQTKKLWTCFKLIFDCADIYAFLIKEMLNEAKK